MSGYKIACREACKYIENNLSAKVSDLGKDALINCAKTSMSSKIIGAEMTFSAKWSLMPYNMLKLEINIPLKQSI